MSFFDDDPEPVRRRPVAPGGPSGRSRALAITAVVMIVLFFLLSSFTGIYTDRLWFNSLDYGSVFTKILGTKVLLFVVFGVLFGGFVFATAMLAFIGLLIFGAPGLLIAGICAAVWHHLMRRRFSRPALAGGGRGSGDPRR